MAGLVEDVSFSRSNVRSYESKFEIEARVIGVK